MSCDGAKFVRFAPHQRKLKGLSAKKTLFLPPEPDEGQEREISVFSAKGATCDDLKKAAKHVAREQGRPVYGGLFTLREAFEIEDLSICLDALRFGESVHANIRGWPREKLDQMEIAKRLAEASCVRELDTPIHPPPAP